MSYLNDAVKRLQATILQARRRHFLSVFDLSGDRGRDVERVLADLRDFCRAEASTFDPDPHMAAFRAGKREVWLRIQYFLNLSDAEVNRLVEVKSDYVDERE